MFTERIAFVETLLKTFIFAATTNGPRRDGIRSVAHRWKRRTRRTLERLFMTTGGRSPNGSPPPLGRRDFNWTECLINFTEAVELCRSSRLALLKTHTSSWRDHGQFHAGFKCLYDDWLTCLVVILCSVDDPRRRNLSRTVWNWCESANMRANFLCNLLSFSRTIPHRQLSSISNHVSRR